MCVCVCVCERQFLPPSTRASIRETGVVINQAGWQADPRALLSKHFGLGGAFDLELFPQEFFGDAGDSNPTSLGWKGGGEGQRRGEGQTPGGFPVCWVNSKNWGPTARPELPAPPTSTGGTGVAASAGLCAKHRL